MYIFTKKNNQRITVKLQFSFKGVILGLNHIESFVKIFTVA